MLCEYGCGQPAKHQFKNGKWCCSKYSSQCPEIKRKISKKLSGITVSKETIEKRKRTSLKKYGVDNPSKSNEIIEKIKETFLRKYGVDNISKLPEIKRKLSHTIKDIQDKFPFFSRIEEMRYNPDKPQEREIQVHCKNHLCENSKEKGGWFTPTKDQFKSRKDWLEREGRDLCYLYCSQDCKDKCVLYQSKGSVIIDEQKIFTASEYNSFRKEVLRRQKEIEDYNFCEHCYTKKKLKVHHEKPIKTHSHLALDPDNGIVLCEKCHYIIGHKNECSTGSLATKLICN